MQRKEIDTRARACPQPVLMTKAALDEGHRLFVVVVDNEAAAQNISRFATNSGCSVTVLSKDNTMIRLEICRPDADNKPEKAHPSLLRQPKP